MNQSDHVFEMRTYHAVPGKLEAVIARFADHTEALFKRHGIKTLGYWVARENSKNLLFYIVDHDSREAAEKNWKAFQNDEEWKKVKADSEANGKITTKVESVFLIPTDFSKLK